MEGRSHLIAAIISPFDFVVSFVQEVMPQQGQKNVKKKIELPGDLEEKERYEQIEGRKLGKQLFLPGCDILLTLPKKKPKS